MAQVSFTMKKGYSLTDVNDIIRMMESAGYVYEDSEKIDEETRLHLFYNTWFQVQIYSDLYNNLFTGVDVHMYKQKGNCHSGSTPICSSYDVSKSTYMFSELPKETVIEILSNIPNEEVVGELQNLSIDKMLEPLND